MWNSTLLNRALALVLVVAMTGCHSAMHGTQANLAATPSCPQVFGPVPLSDAGEGGLSNVSSNPLFDLDAGDVFLLFGIALLLSPILIGGWLVGGLRELADLLRR